MQVEEVQPSLRLCEIRKSTEGTCGFHLSRTRADPYPWVSNLDADSPAGTAGLSVGDCVLEVNGEDILGLKISQVAEKVRARSEEVILLVWNATEQNEGTAPAVLNLQKLSSYFESAVQLLECPVCLEISSLPTYQCSNGHIVCGNCRPRTHKCPICRVILSGRGRCLLAEKLNVLLTKTFVIKDDNKIVKYAPVNGKTISTKVKNFTFVKEPKFFCPWGGKCEEMLEGSKSVLPHVKSRHNGPVLQYYLRVSEITIRRPQQDTLVSIQDEDGTLFFAQMVGPDMFCVTVLGDECKADHYEYVVEKGRFHRTNALTTPPQQIVANKWYQRLPQDQTDIRLQIRIIDG